MDKETTAIFRLQQASEMSERLYNKPLVVTYSGGKDSDVLLHLADAAGIDYEVTHNLTTVDAPETIHHVRDVFHTLQNDGIKCTIDVHEHDGGGCDTMWNLIPRKLMPPTRVARYCCTILKQGNGKGQFNAMGVRWSESPRRSNRAIFEVVARKKENRIRINSMDNDEDRQIFESCPIKSKRTVSPIIDWTDDDIWDYINAEHIKTNPLYDCGFQRVGCVGCPMTRRAERYARFERWPKYKENYMRAFDKMLEARKAKGRETRGWNNADDVFHWWMEDPVPEETEQGG